MGEAVAQEVVVVAIDDEIDILEAYRRALSSKGIELRCESSPAKGLERIRESTDEIDAVMLDIDMPDMSGLELLRSIRELDRGMPVVMVTGDATAGTAVKAMRAGASNYVTKPIRDYGALASVLRAAADHRQLRRRVSELEAKLAAAERFHELIGDSQAMADLRETIERVAPLDVTVLLRGESGTGKELVARAIHRGSARQDGPFVAVNCAALPPTLIDSTLFGHVKGAFTGAVESRPGIFEQASGGTVFLDEIGDITPDVQVRLLRVLQEREVLAVGARQATPIDVRVIAATLVDLDQAVADGDFREDLYYRLDVVSLDLPPLRQREDDVAILAAHFVRKHAERMGREVPTLSEDALAALRSYQWPGNVRQLENAIESAVALAPGDVIRAERLTKKITSAPVEPDTSRGADSAWADGLQLVEARKLLQESFDKAYIERRLEENDHVITRAAEAAGMERSNFRRLMRRLGMAGK